MRNRQLHDALRDFALEAAALLTDEVREGAELRFELDEEPGGGATLYRYRPLTSDFIAERWPRLRALPAREAAGSALGEGASAYLRVRGVPGVDPDPALKAMLERLYDESTDFGFPEERFERVYAEVERTLFDDTLTATVIAPMPGVRLDPERVELGDGLALVAHTGSLDAPSEAVWAADGEQPPEPAALCVLERASPARASLPVEEARGRFHRLLTAMRLLKPGLATLGSVAWARADTGAWRAIRLAPGGPGRGPQWELGEGEEAELRELLGVLEASRPVGPVAWALARFEMGCERALDSEAISDYLLALGALLDGDHDTGRAGLGLRLAALCAEETDRQAVRRRVELAFAFERLAIAGGGADPYLDEIGPEGAGVLVAEMEGHLRALLRDVLCGYLDADLKGAADDILLRSGAPIDVRAEDLRTPAPRHGTAPSGDPDTGEMAPVAAGDEALSSEGAETYAADDAGDPEPARSDTPPGKPRRSRRSQLTRSPPAGGAPPSEPEPQTRATPLPRRDPEPPPDAPPPAAAVTPSADWAFDEDPASYSAPV
jgi:hypothetical protein